MWQYQKIIPLEIGRLWGKNSRKNPLDKSQPPFLGNSQRAKFHHEKKKDKSTRYISTGRPPTNKFFLLPKLDYN
jgi:hypothetical protein